MTEEDIIRFVERSQQETLERVARALDESGTLPDDADGAVDTEKA